jgi:transcriptional regulator with XRE-family HTH domain
VDVTSIQEAAMQFSERIRELRKAKNLSLRALAEAAGVSFTYISKIENDKLDFGDYPSEDLIGKLAAALGADKDELLLLAKKVPPEIRERLFERPDAFRKLASLDDAALDKFLQDIEKKKRKGK